MKSLTLIVLFTLLLLQNLKAQEDIENNYPTTYFGTTLGNNFSNVFEDPKIIDPNFGSGYSIGISGETFLEKSNSNSIVYSFNITQRSLDFGEITISDKFGNTSKAESDERSNYFCFSTSYKGNIFNFSDTDLSRTDPNEKFIRNLKRFYYRAGIYLAYLSSVNGTTDSKEYEVDLAMFNRFDVGLDLGLGYQRNFSKYLISIEYNFQQGLLNKIENADLFLNYTHSINLLFNFPL